jgi:hypothetical protein
VTDLANHASDAPTAALPIRLLAAGERSECSRHGDATDPALLHRAKAYLRACAHAGDRWVAVWYCPSHRWLVVRGYAMHPGSVGERYYWSAFTCLRPERVAAVLVDRMMADAPYRGERVSVEGSDSRGFPSVDGTGIVDGEPFISCGDTWRAVRVMNGATGGDTWAVAGWGAANG